MHTGAKTRQEGPTTIITSHMPNQTLSLGSREEKSIPTLISGKENIIPNMTLRCLHPLNRINKCINNKAKMAKQTQHCTRVRNLTKKQNITRHKKWHWYTGKQNMAGYTLITLTEATQRCTQAMQHKDTLTADWWVQGTSICDHKAMQNINFQRKKIDQSKQNKYK